jgi:hypothetical protein
MITKRSEVMKIMGSGPREVCEYLNREIPGDGFWSTSDDDNVVAYWYADRGDTLCTIERHFGTYDLHYKSSRLDYNVARSADFNVIGVDVDNIVPLLRFVMNVPAALESYVSREHQERRKVLEAFESAYAQGALDGEE